MNGDAMIVLDRLSAREAPVALSPATFTLGPGAHALVGSREDGTGLALAAIAGRARARTGTVRVLGSPPGARDVARTIAHVPRDVSLPEVLRVFEVLEMAWRVRGEQPARNAQARLGTLGVAELADRKVRSLLPPEARAVALAEALTSSARVLLFEEPFAALDPRAASHLVTAIRKRAALGACIVVATASLREAAEIADDHLLFERGTFVHRTSALGDVTARGAGHARLRVVVNDPRTLLAALAAETAPREIHADARSVTLLGPDVVQLADAVARALNRARVEVESMRTESAPLEELRASIAGDAAAAYRAAMERRAPAPIEIAPASTDPAQPPPLLPPLGGPP